MWTIKTAKLTVYYGVLKKTTLLGLGFIGLVLNTLIPFLLTAFYAYIKQL